MAIFITSCSESGRNPFTNQTQKGHPYFDFVYSPIIAERFSLPKANAVNLSDEVVAVGLQIDSLNNTYNCSIHIYTSTRINLFTPNNNTNYFAPREQEITIINAFNEADQKQNIERFEMSHGYALFRKDTDPTFIATLDIGAVRKNYFSDLSVASIPLECELLKPEYQPASLWVQKSGYPENPVGVVESTSLPDSTSAYQFVIPQSLLLRNSNLINYVAKENSK